MLIVCPTCATSYMVDQAALGAAGRTVRCARCKTAWFAGAPEPAHETATAEPIDAEAAPQPVRAVRTMPASAEAAPTPVEEQSPEPSDRQTSSTAPAADDSAHVARAGEQPEGATDGELVTVVDAPPIAPNDDAPHPGANSESEADSFDTRRRLLQARRKQSRRSSRWMAVALLLVAVNVAMVGGRNEVVRYLPQTASLFAAIGLPVNLRNLKFENVKLTTNDADGVAMLNVTGTIVSESGRPVGVPRLRFAMRNAQGQDVYTWTIAPPRSVIEPGDRVQFRSQIPVPKVDAADVMVRFLTPQDAGAK